MFVQLRWFTRDDTLDAIFYITGDRAQTQIHLAVTSEIPRRSVVRGASSDNVISLPKLQQAGYDVTG